MRAILPPHPLLPDQSRISLVNQCRRLEGVVSTLSSQVGSSLPPQLTVHEWNDGITGLNVASPPCPKQPAYDAGSIHRTTPRIATPRFRATRRHRYLVPPPLVAFRRQA